MDWVTNIFCTKNRYFWVWIRPSTEPAFETGIDSEESTPPSCVACAPQYVHKYGLCAGILEHLWELGTEYVGTELSYRSASLGSLAESKHWTTSQSRQSIGFFSSRPNWPPPPHIFTGRRMCPLPFGSGREHSRLRKIGWVFPIRTMLLTLSYTRYTCNLWATW